MVSYAKYSLVPTEDPKDGGESKAVPSTFDYSSAFSYKSAFEYNSNDSNKRKKREAFTAMRCISAFLTVMSYIIIGITFPCTLWFCLKRLQQWERLIVFRLGRLRGVLGPGVVFVIPWLDRHTRVDMRTKAFSVPPQQLITADNGIIEMGCEVKYRVADVQQLTTTVTSPQHGLRSFGKTVLLNVLTKHTVKEMERDRLLISSEILKDINSRVHSWGIEIGEVDLSTVNILKEPEPNNPLKPILSALNSQGQGNSASQGSISDVTLGGKGSFMDFGTIAKMSGLAGFQGFSVSGMDKKPKMESGDLIQLSDEPKIPSIATSLQFQKDNKGTGPTCAPKTKLGRYLQGLVAGQTSGDLSHGVYRLQVEGKDSCVYIIFIGNGIRQVVEGDLPKITPDVSIVMTKDDLTAILEGTLSPLQAYLSGRLTVSGSVQLLMGLESLRQANSSTTDKGDIFVV